MSAILMLSLYTDKSFLNLAVAFFVRLYFATAWIVTGNVSTLSRIQYIFFQGGLPHVSFHCHQSLTHFLIQNLYFPKLHPFNLRFLAVWRSTDIFGLTLRLRYFKTLQHLSNFLSNTLPNNCSWWKQRLIFFLFFSCKPAFHSQIHFLSLSKPLNFSLPVFLT